MGCTRHSEALESLILHPCTVRPNSGPALVPSHQPTSFLATGQQTSILAACPLGKQLGQGLLAIPDSARRRACIYHCLIQTPRLFLLTQASRSELRRALGRRAEPSHHSARPGTSRLFWGFSRMLEQRTYSARLPFEHSLLFPE